VRVRAVDRLPPGDDASDLDWLLFRQDGVLTWRQAVEAVGAGRARTMTSSGRWRSVCRGVIVANNGPITYPGALWIAMLAAGRGAMLAGLSAANEAGLRGFRSFAIHLLIPPRRPYANLVKRLPDEMPPVIQHRTSLLPPQHIQRARPMRTTTARALVDAAQWARSDNEARTIVAAACQQRLVTPDEVIAVANALPRARRRALTIETANYAQGGATALSEIDLVKLCKRHGLPAPDMQERRKDASGRVRYIDAYWRDFKIQVEVDGAHHMFVRQWEADMLRQNDLWLPGERILRFSAWQVRHQPELVAGKIRTALMEAGWTG